MASRPAVIPTTIEGLRALVPPIVEETEEERAVLLEVADTQAGRDRVAAEVADTERLLEATEEKAEPIRFYRLKGDLLDGRRRLAELNERLGVVRAGAAEIARRRNEARAIATRTTLRPVAAELAADALGLLDEVKAQLVGLDNALSILAEVGEWHLPGGVAVVHVGGRLRDAERALKAVAERK